MLLVLSKLVAVKLPPQQQDEQLLLLQNSQLPLQLVGGQLLLRLVWPTLIPLKHVLLLRADPTTIELSLAFQLPF